MTNLPTNLVKKKRRPIKGEDGLFVAQPEPPIVRTGRDANVSHAYRQTLDGPAARRCEVCRWRIPRGLDLLGGTTARVHVHHIVPLAHGGTNELTNLIQLCPNHHAIAHALGEAHDKKGRRVPGWSGPNTKAWLIHEIRLLNDRAAWQKWIDGGRDWARHCEDEVIRSERRFTMIEGGAA